MVSDKKDFYKGIIVPLYKLLILLFFLDICACYT